MTEQPAIDAKALARLEKWGGRDLVRELIALFHEGVRVRLAQVRTGLDSGSLEEVERGAHTLKSSSGNLGATRVYELAAQIEGEVRSASPDKLRQLLTGLERECARALKELKGIEKGLTV